MNTKTDIRITDEIKSFNFGIGLICAYFVMDFGSFQGLYPIFNKLKIPFIVALLLLLYSIVCIFAKRNKINKLILFSLVFLLIDTLVRTINYSAERNLVILFVTYISCYIIVLSSVHKISELILLIDGFLASVAFSSVHGIIQGGLVWSNTWLSDENQFTVICVMCLPLAYYLYINSTNKIKKICYTICMFLYTVLIFRGLSRGGLLALFGVTILIWSKSQKKLKMLATFLVLATLIISFAPQKIINEIKNIDIDEQAGSAGERLYLWKLGMDMFLDNPLHGIGLANYGEYFVEYDMRHEKRDKFGGVTWRGQKWVLHSTPMTILTELGIIGCLLFIFLQRSLYQNARAILIQKMQYPLLNQLSTACLVSQIGFWVGSIFLSLLVSPFFWLLVIFSEAVKNCALEYQNAFENNAGYKEL